MPRENVWEALAVIHPYCGVCDVSYTVIGGSGNSPGKGTTFSCSPGRVAAKPPTMEAPAWEIIEWEPQERVVTHVVLAAEAWMTQLTLADAGKDATRVVITVMHNATAGSRWVRWARRPMTRRMIQRIVDDELAKLPAHIGQMAPTAPGATE